MKLWVQICALANELVELLVDVGAFGLGLDEHLEVQRILCLLFNQTLILAVEEGFAHFEEQAQLV